MITNVFEFSQTNLLILLKRCRYIHTYRNTHTHTHTNTHTQVTKQKLIVIQQFATFHEKLNHLKLDIKRWKIKKIIKKLVEKHRIMSNIGLNQRPVALYVV